MVIAEKIQIDCEINPKGGSSPPATEDHYEVIDNDVSRGEGGIEKPDTSKPPSTKKKR